MTRMPSYFISHGGGPWPWLPPMRAQFHNLEASLKRIVAELPEWRAGWWWEEHASALDIASSASKRVAGDRTIAVDLAPSKREFQITMDYEIEIERDTDLMLSLVHALNRGHVAGVEETGVFMGFRKTF